MSKADELLREQHIVESCSSMNELLQNLDDCHDFIAQKLMDAVRKKRSILYKRAEEAQKNLGPESKDLLKQAQQVEDLMHDVVDAANLLGRIKGDCGRIADQLGWVNKNASGQNS